MPILVAQNVKKSYWVGTAAVNALRGVSLEVQSGEFLAVMGPSGCGKSTLLHLFGGMERVSEGSLLFEGKGLEWVSDEQLTLMRRTRIGFVFQFFNLMPTLTAAENVALPLRLAGADAQSAAERAAALLAEVGLESRADHFPHQLSGGELQRAAIARAIVHSPSLLLADEPTGNLDSSHGTAVLDLLSRLNQEMGLTMVLATHSGEVAKAANRVIYLRDGLVEKSMTHS